MRRKLQKITLFPLLLLGLLAIVALSRWLSLPAGAALRPYTGQLDLAQPTKLPVPHTAIPPSKAPTLAPPAPFNDKPQRTVQAQATELYGKLPLSFEVNQGQTHEDVRFLSRGKGYTLFLTSTEAVMVLRKPSAAPGNAGVAGLGKKRWLSRGSQEIERGTEENTPQAGSVESQAQTVIRMKLVGANPSSEATGIQELPGKSNYFIGNDPAKWRTNIPSYAKVKYQDVYSGVDLVYYGNQRQLEYDFVVAPGADPSVIKLAFEGADKLEVDTRGDLIFHTSVGQIQFRKPFVYQEIAGFKKEIAGAYILNAKSDNENPKSRMVGFQLAAYDITQPVIIDPVLAYSTFLGGSNPNYEFASGIAVDSAGNAYVTGLTASDDFPTKNPLDSGISGFGDAFVSKLSPTGSFLVYSTYLGGSDTDNGYGIAVDGLGNAYVTGLTSSADFPADGRFPGPGPGNMDGFVVKLNPTGSELLYSTFLGGRYNDWGLAVTVDTDGNAYVAGAASSDDFPITEGAYQTSGEGGFVIKLDPTGIFVYSTFIANLVTAIAVDSLGYAYVTGFADERFRPTASAFQPRCVVSHSYGCWNAFVAKLNPEGSDLVYGTFLGGSGGNTGNGIAIDSQGNAYVAGTTDSPDFPTMNPIRPCSIIVDAFVTKLNPSGSSLIYSTCLGGYIFDQGEEGNGIAVDSEGNAYVVGSTQSFDFPTVRPLGPSCGREVDAFVVKLDPIGTRLIYSTCLVGTGFDYGNGIAVDRWGNAYVTGEAEGADFPTMNAFQPIKNSFSDAFVSKIVEPFALATPSLPTGEVGLFYQASFEVVGGSPPYVVSVAAGALPAGLKLGSPTIIGTPTLAGSKRFTIRVTDQLGTSVSKIFTLNILRALSISTTSLRAGVLGRSYAASLRATGGKTPYTWLLTSGNLPTGLSLQSATGTITGLPTQTGVFNLTFQVTDPLGGQAHKNLPLTIR